MEPKPKVPVVVERTTVFADKIPTTPVPTVVLVPTTENAYENLETSTVTDTTSNPSTETIMSKESKNFFEENFSQASSISPLTEKDYDLNFTEDTILESSGSVISENESTSEASLSESNEGNDSLSAETSNTTFLSTGENESKIESPTFIDGIIGLRPPPLPTDAELKNKTDVAKRLYKMFASYCSDMT
ncbi:unnamed protein product [Caenorhabditis bovis]|uniref:Uncharacterized protein n=1 Tax=Caenorhabditis bovis TaxID=2654633 RepID=A0A8S1ELG2_9PELO|nr:unnamed protein product [Caenorhabditis bovis]